MKSKRFDNLSEEKEYIVSGTIDEIISILTSDFGLTPEEARFVTYLSTIEKRDKIVFEEEELKLWYLREVIPSTAPIFKLPYTISITKLKLEIQHQLFIFLGTLVLNKEVGITALALDFIWALKDAIQKITEDEFCIYGRIVDFVYATQKDSFMLEDIIPYDKDMECNRKPDTWKCPYWNNEVCSLTKQRIRNILDKLVQKGVLMQVNQYWKMIK